MPTTCLTLPLDHAIDLDVLACYKRGIILKGTCARARAGKAPKETGDRLHASTTGLLESANRWIS